MVFDPSPGRSNTRARLLQFLQRGDRQLLAIRHPAQARELRGQLQILRHTRASGCQSRVSTSPCSERTSPEVLDGLDQRLIVRDPTVNVVAVIESVKIGFVSQLCQMPVKTCSHMITYGLRGGLLSSASSRSSFRTG